MTPDLTLAAAFGAGLLSFLSPCVLPLVPAYLGQLTIVAVVGREQGNPSRWLAVRHAIAYVVGFGLVFTLLGVTATFVGGPLASYLPLLRQIGVAVGKLEAKIEAEYAARDLIVANAAATVAAWP